MQTQETEIVVTRRIQVRQVFDDEHKPDADDQPAEHDLVCCTCLKPRPNLLLGDCACLVCGQCWALQGGGMYCLNCQTKVNYIQMKEVIEFPAKGNMGKLFPTMEFKSMIVNFSEIAEKRSKVQMMASKILDKQQAALKNKISLERKEFQKRRKEMDELVERIAVKTESIKDLEEEIRRVIVSEDSEPTRKDLLLAQTRLPFVTKPPGKRIRQTLPSFQSSYPGLNSTTQVKSVNETAQDKIIEVIKVPDKSRERTEKSLFSNQVSDIIMSENLITKSHAKPIQETRQQTLAPLRSLSSTQDYFVKKRWVLASKARQGKGVR